MPATPALALSLNPVADSFVRQPQPGVNFGSLDFIRTDMNERGFLSFDLSDIPPGSTIEDATLILCLSASPPAAAVGRVMEFRLAQDPWTENGITWSNQPGTSGSSNAAFVIPGFASCVSFAVKDDIDEWLADGDNYGWMFARRRRAERLARPVPLPRGRHPGPAPHAEHHLQQLAGAERRTSVLRLC